jgi:F-type H+-transporting ATPase subunit delta
MNIGCTSRTLWTSNSWRAIFSASGNKKQYNEINKIATASVKTAVEASAEIKAEIKNFLQQQSGKNVELKMHVDPSLIGGVMIQMEDRLYDASISGSLRKAKQQLLNTYISK